MFISLTILAERVFFLKRYARLHAIVIPKEQRKVGGGGGGGGGGRGGWKLFSLKDLKDHT